MESTSSQAPRKRSIDEILALPRTEKLTLDELKRLEKHVMANTGPGLAGDPWIHTLVQGNLQDMQMDFDSRFARLGSRQAALDELASLRWGLSEQGILSMLCVAMSFSPEIETDLHSKASFFLALPLPVDSTNIYGCTALAVTSRYLAKSSGLKYATMLYEAGADVNAVDRAGWNICQEGAGGNMIVEQTDIILLSLRWLIDRGGNMDFAESRSARSTGRALVLSCLHKMHPSDASQAQDLLASYDARREKARDKACGFCLGLGRKGRQGKEEMQCGRCLSTLYCGKECQKRDWQHHKKTCSPPPP